MSTKHEQVPISKLVFTHNWEDPESDHAALQIKPGQSMMAITSGGCNVLGFLLFDPAVVYAIDINAAQSYLLELKIAAIESLVYKEFVAFAGLQQHPGRIAAYQKMKPLLSPEATEFWKEHEKIIEAGFIMQGRYERFIKIASKCIILLQGKQRVMDLFADKSMAEQQNYFDTVWNTRRFHYLFKLLFNKRMLARRGLVADYFQFDDGSKSFAESFYNRAKKALRNNPVTGNYFLSLYLLGKYQNLTDLPNYMRRENFEQIRSRLGRVQIITAEAQSWIDKMRDESIDCFALSNICELMSEKETDHLFKGVLRTARQGSKLIFRNLMVPRDVPENLRHSIQKNETLSRQIFESDRSFVYGKVAAYEIMK